MGHDGPGAVRAYCIGAGLQWSRSAPPAAFEKKLEKNRGGFKFKQITFSWEAELEAE
jgi:hypothetical protein